MFGVINLSFYCDHHVRLTLLCISFEWIEWIYFLYSDLWYPYPFILQRLSEHVQSLRWWLVLADVSIKVFPKMY